MNPARRVVAVVILMVATSLSAYAQGSAGEIIAGWTESLKRFLLMLMGLGTLVSLAFSVYKMIDGKQEAAKKLLFIFVSFGIGTALLVAVARFVPASVPAGSGGFDGIREMLKAVLQGVIVLVAMIAIGTLTVQMINGDEQAYRKVITWVIVVSVGSAILNAVGNV